MEHNRLKIVDYSEGTRPIEELFLNDKKIDYILDYSINKKTDELSVLTLVIDCKEVEIIKGDIEERMKENANKLGMQNNIFSKKGEIGRASCRERVSSPV